MLNSLKFYFSLKDISSGTGSLNKARLKYEIYLMLNTGPIAMWFWTDLSWYRIYWSGISRFRSHSTIHHDYLICNNQNVFPTSQKLRRSDCHFPIFAEKTQHENSCKITPPRKNLFGMSQCISKGPQTSYFSWILNRSGIILWLYDNQEKSQL